MTWRTAALLTPALAGCSLIYNPNNLPTPRDGDGGIENVDAPPVVDANDSLLALLDISSATINEGQGDGGSLPALFVIRGQNIVNNKLKVELVAPPGVTVKLSPVTDAVASADAGFLAFTVTAHVDTELADDVQLDVKVTQEISAQYGGGTVTKQLPIPLTLHGLRELTSSSPEINAGVMTLPASPKLYSMVNLQNISFAPSASPAIFNAVSSIKLGAVNAAATPSAAGPGGSPSGTMGGPGAGGGGGAAAVIGDGGGGGGGGFAFDGERGAPGSATGGPPGAKTGDDQLRSLTGNPSSAGGSGGAGLSALGGLPGGAGGAGGGVVALTAGGDITTNTVTVKGGTGVSPSGLGLINGGGGGGGTGGVVVMRTMSGALQTGAIDVSGGPGGSPGGGKGSEGRMRWDAAASNSPLALAPRAHRGPTFQNPTRVVTAAGQSFVVTGSSGDELDVYVVDHDDASARATVNDSGIATITPRLAAGYNRLCVKLADGTRAEPLSNACIDVAFVP